MLPGRCSGGAWLRVDRTHGYSMREGSQATLRLARPIARAGGVRVAKQQEMWTLDDREVRVSSLDKLFWPDDGLTKGDLLNYYREIAPVLLPYMQDRPFTMRVWPDGIGGKNFYRWRVPPHAPEWLERFLYEPVGPGKPIEMAVVDELSEPLVCHAG
jgi:hypothetical protein